MAPAAPGGGWDQLARTMQRVLEAEGLAAPVTVENIPGAAGTLGLARFVSGRRGDARTLLVTGLVMVGGIEQNGSPVTLRDAIPLARLVGEYEAIAVPAASPYRTLGDLLDAFRREPGAIAWGGGSAGGTDQILVDLVAGAVGVPLDRTRYVAFAGGGEARTALLGSQVTAGVSGIGEFAELAASGAVRILAVSAPQRVPGTDAPTLRETGINVVLSNWRGLMAAPGVKPADRAQLEELVRGLAASPAWRSEARGRGWEELPLFGVQFERFLDAESDRVRAIAAARRSGTRLQAAPPSTLPATLGGLLIVLLAAGLWRRRWPAPRPGAWRGVAVVLAAMGINVLVVDQLGFIAGAVVLYLTTAAALGTRRWGVAVTVAAVFSLAVFALFRVVLGVPLPVGSAWSMLS